MAEASITDTSKLNPESAEFVPQSKPNQPHSRRGYRQLDTNRHHARPQNRFRQSSGIKHGQDEFESPKNDASPPSEQPIRGSARGGRGKGVRQRGGRSDARHTDYHSQPERWVKPESDSDSSGMTHRAGGSQQEPHDSSLKRSKDEERQERHERPPVKASMRGSYRGSRQKNFKDRDDRSIKEPLPSNREENPESQVAGRVRKPAGVREHPPELEPDQRNQGWRGGDRRMQPSSWRKGPVLNRGIQGNWREREPVQVREEEWKGAESEGGKQDESNRNRAGAKGKQALQQNPGQKRGSERRTGPVKSMAPPKSKETQTGCLIEQLTEEKYECMVCCEVIRVMAPVWSCQSCFHVFHLNCIKKWARSPASQADEGSEGWRCPACQHVAPKGPNAYTCFCGKVTNPEYQRTEIPHSCGDMCGKKRSGAECNHPCNILCHPGPCPQCPAFVNKSCICGRMSKQVRCSQTGPLLCQQVCGALLNCSQHSCAQVCHSGPCQPCQLRVQQACFCGVVFREVACGTDCKSFDGSGYFSCCKPCGKMLDCQSHRCEQSCHPGQCQPCPHDPKLVHSCSCGQTRLSKLLELGYPERKTCTDPVPSCGKTCNKPMPCGDGDSIHLCEKLCHEDTCGPCSLTSTMKCRCGSNSKEVPCAVIQTKSDMVFTCEKRCSKKRSCGRHKCGDLCCVDKEHKCLMICGYKLNCGLHRCQELCHRGNCHPCWQTSFDELACYCGETVLYPPIPCGTKPPECKNVCTRKHDCDHPVFHSCHSEDRCPPCTYLTKKWCMGNHELRSNIPCHLQDISCGLVCDKLLPCGSHRCKKLCHRGECQGEGECKQPCTYARPTCGHPCAAPCHSGTPCPPSTCSAKVAVQCDCGHKKETVPCADAATSFQRYAAIAVASKLSDMQLGESVDIGQLTKKEQKKARLECDQECATLERNRRLAEALQIDQSVDPFNKSTASKYSDSLKEDARKDFKFVSEIEEEIKNLVELANKGKQPKRGHCFPPMKREHRRIIHELAEAYGVESVSYDSEPKRNVVLTAIRGKSVCPNTTLTALIERETVTRAPPPIAHIKQHNSKVENSAAWMKPAKEEPTVDYFDVQD